MDYTESNVTTNSVMECSQEGVCERVTTRCVDNVILVLKQEHL